jgi:hypothetical protein
MTKESEKYLHLAPSFGKLGHKAQVEQHKERTDASPLRFVNKNSKSYF